MTTMFTLYTNGQIMFAADRGFTGCTVAQEPDGTAVWRNGARLHLPARRYALSTDTPASGIPGRAAFERDLHNALWGLTIDDGVDFLMTAEEHRARIALAFARARAAQTLADDAQQAADEAWEDHTAKEEQAADAAELAFETAEKRKRHGAR